MINNKILQKNAEDLKTNIIKLDARLNVIPYINKYHNRYFKKKGSELSPKSYTDGNKKSRSENGKNSCHGGRGQAYKNYTFVRNGLGKEHKNGKEEKKTELFYLQHTCKVSQRGFCQRNNLGFLRTA